MKLTIEEFEMLTDFIYRKCGIRFENKKMYFIEKRIEKRMEILGYESPLEYIRYLRFIDQRDKEFQELINLLTVNESYFFRDFPQLQAFAEHSLQGYASEKKLKGDMNLKIWSAGCSTGEEPYTIAIILSEMLDNFEDWKIEIIASDIDQNVMDFAKRGHYGEEKLREVPPEYFFKYFQRLSNSKYAIDRKMKRMISFEHLNLGDRKSLRPYVNFDFIFCRNVLIYFDDISRKRIVDHFYLALNPNGYIFLGSSESVGRITTAFKIKRAGDYLVYSKE